MKYIIHDSNPKEPEYRTTFTNQGELYDTKQDAVEEILNQVYNIGNTGIEQKKEQLILYEVVTQSSDSPSGPDESIISEAVEHMRELLEDGLKPTEAHNKTLSDLL